MKTEVLAFCPGCGLSFITSNGNQNYCSKECYDFSYNKLYRDKSSYYINTLKKNVEKLKWLIGDNREVVLPIEDFMKLGFDFEIYSDRKPADFNPSLYYLIYAGFSTNLTTTNQIKIAKI